MDNDLHRTRYNEIKQRNQETLAHMQRLEHELERVKAEIRDKKLRSLILRAYQQTCTQRTLRLKAYHELLSSFNRDDRQALPRDRIDHLCKQLEETLLTRRVERVPRDIISQDPASLVDTALSQITATLLSADPAPLSSLTPPPPPLPELETQPPLHDDGTDYHQELAMCEAKYNEVLKRVHDRAQHVYPDMRIQTAVVESIQSKAESIGSTAELEAMKQVSEAWRATEASRVQTRMDMENSKTDEDGTSLLEALVESVAQKQRRVYQLMASNRAFPQRIHKQREQVAEFDSQQGELVDELVELCRNLVGTIRKQLDVFHRAPLAPDSINIVPTTPDGTRLGQIKDALHPYLELSREGVIHSLTDTLTRVNALAHTKQPEPSIREPLESLAERWHDDLIESGVELPQSLQNEDSVDAIVQSVTAYKHFIKHKQTKFVAEEEARIRPQLEMLGRAERSVCEVMEAIEERKHLEDASIAMEYAYEGKTFAEWMSLLFRKHHKLA